MATHRVVRSLRSIAVLTFWFFCASLAMADGPQHVRGTLTSVQGQQLAVQTTRGKTVTITIGDKTGLFIVTRSDLSAIQPGKFVGITSIERDGKRMAREVHIFNEALRGRGEGHYPWDLESEPNMMTNANIAKVDAVGGDDVLKLNYPGGEQTIAVSPSTEIVAFDKTGPDQLVGGRQVFVIITNQDDPATPALGIVIGAEGVKPPM
jgi:hypothetical protein